jgi:hypothetical protein
VPYEYYYPDYKDLSTGKTLVVVPGSSYTIALAPGRIAAAPAYPNDGRWTSSATFQALELEFEVPVPGVAGEEVKITYDKGNDSVEAIAESEPEADNKEGA